MPTFLTAFCHMRSGVMNFPLWNHILEHFTLGLLSLNLFCFTVISLLFHTMSKNLLHIHVYVKIKQQFFTFCVFLFSEDPYKLVDFL
jgi:hypothetical protein